MATLDPAQIRLRGVTRRGRGAVLALNGSSSAELRRTSTLIGTMAGSSLLVAVDGGLRTCRAARRAPDLFVGDGDSAGRVPDDLPAARFPCDKDFSDLAGALFELRKKKVRIVGVAGLLGGRLDHEWANLFELARHAGEFAGFVAPTDRGTVVVTARGCSVADAAGRPFSMFALGSSAVVSLEGARWSLDRRRLSPGSHGLSNVCEAKLEFAVHRGTVALLLLPR